MRTFVLLCAVALVSSCASKGNVIETSGTAALTDAEVARVAISNALSLLTVDGKAVPSPRGHARYEVRLAPGSRRLRFAYEENWSNANEYDWVYSDHAVEIVLDARPGFLYRAEYPEPTNLREARQLAGDLRVWIDDSLGKRIESRQVAAHGSPLTRLIGTRAGSAAAAAPPPGANGDRVGEAEALLAEQDALQRLKLWWKLASTEQRRRFQAWINGAELD